MREVWFVFRLVEGILSTLCMAWHIYGFLYKDEPLNHEMYFCGTFFGFTCISIFTNIGTIKGATVPLFLEAVIATFACVFFLVCSFMSMHYAEKDFHLMYLSDYEESVHPFFYINKCQSIASLTCGITYLLHALFAIDALIITAPTSLEPMFSGTKVEENEATQPIKLYLFCIPLFKYCHCDCCDNIRCCKGINNFFLHTNSEIKV